MPIFQPELGTMPRPELERLQPERLRERFGVTAAARNRRRRSAVHLPVSDQTEPPANDADEWPLPSQDVLRELEPPAVVWSQAEPAASWPTRRTGTG